jgi:L-seryl-tRNA(Ser) seleniumtransferase
VTTTEALRALPSVERLLGSPAGRALTTAYRRDRVTATVRDVLADARGRIRAGDPTPSGEDDVLAETARRLAAAASPPTTRVVNATGVCLHTNLGRALLPEAAIAAMVEVARHPTALELDLATGMRGRRDALVEADLRALTGAEAGLVVNNNAAGVLLALATLAAGREVVVSRGELVEIGGSFRLPDVMAASGARLHEVGTTNRTHADDYRRAIGPETALLMKVHPSNFAVVGFTAAVALGEVVQIGREAGLPVIEDLGSGALVDLATFGLPREPVVRDRVAAGADLVLFSGDKLLGGPQAGIVVGRGDLVARLAAHPLRRALRPDKLTLAALGATLRLHRDAPDLAAALPTLRWLTRPVAELEAVGRRTVPVLAAALGPEYRLAIVETEARVGSGAVPAHAIESRAIEVTHPTSGPDAIAARFRAGRPPVVGRIQHDRFLLDLRGVHDPSDLVPEHL